MSAAGSNTRLCVKCLPPYATEVHLRRHFDEMQEHITEVRLLRTRDGRSRNFGFVGFRGSGEAEEALKRYHRTFMGSQRVICELARPRGQEGDAPPWKRAREAAKEERSADRAPKHPKSEAPDGGNRKGPREGASKDERDTALDEFLSVMQPRSGESVFCQLSETPPWRGSIV